MRSPHEEAIVMATAISRVLVIAGAAVALAAGAAPAAAEPPVFKRFPDFGSEVVWPNDDPDGWWAASRCDFPVHYRDEGKGLRIVFPDRTFMAFPGLHATITNLDTDVSVSLPVNGSIISTEVPAEAPGHTVVTETLRGPSLDYAPGQLTWFTGRRVIVTEYDESGEVVSGPLVTQRGPVLDVCALLAH
jgi:hypothetical protein